MQRAAALPSASSNPNSPDIPSPKRRKFSSTTASTALTPPSEAQAIQAVMKAEEDKISQAVDRLAAEAGETKWSLSFVDEVGGVKETGGLQVVTVGYSQIDLGGGKGHGRMSFGTVNRAAEVCPYLLKLFGIQKLSKLSRCLQDIHRNDKTAHQIGLPHRV